MGSHFLAGGEGFWCRPGALRGSSGHKLGYWDGDAAVGGLPLRGVRDREDHVAADNPGNLAFPDRADCRSLPGYVRYPNYTLAGKVIWFLTSEGDYRHDTSQ